MTEQGSWFVFWKFVWLKTQKNLIKFNLSKFTRGISLWVKWTIKNTNSLLSLHYLQLLVNGLRLCVFTAPDSPVFRTLVPLTGREPKTHQAVDQRLGEQQIFVSNMLAPCQDSLEAKKGRQLNGCYVGKNGGNTSLDSISNCIQFWNICGLCLIFSFNHFDPKSHLSILLCILNKLGHNSFSRTATMKGCQVQYLHQRCRMYHHKRIFSWFPIFSPIIFQSSNPDKDPTFILKQGLKSTASWIHSFTIP